MDGTKDGTKSGMTWFHNPTTPLGIKGEKKQMADKKKAASSTTAKKKKKPVRRNPGAIGSAVNLATTALTVGFVNTGINLLTGLLPIPQQGIVGIGSKFGVALGVKYLLPKTKIISQQTSDLLAILIAATAISDAIQPYTDSVFNRLLSPTTQPQQPQQMSDVYSFPQGTFQDVRSFKEGTFNQ